MSGDRTKLPKWAQREIEVLEQDKAYWKAKALMGPSDSNTFSNEGRPLGMNARVRFVLGEHLTVDARIRRGQVEIMASDRLAVIPHSTNVVYVGPY
ncbi:MAG TPA: hypothetical protein VK088_08850 [Acidimicrobiia bacterium]|nr:hypothetical protein [Acidimicrobiia bacterium]